MKKEELLSQEELVKLEQALASSPRDALLLGLLIETGCRPTELLRLRPTEFHDSKLDFPAPRQRCFPLSAALWDLYQRYAAGRDPARPLFAARGNSQLTLRRLRQIVTGYGRAALGRPLSPKALRISAIAGHLNNGSFADAVKERAGLDDAALKRLKPLLGGGEPGAA